MTALLIRPLHGSRKSVTRLQNAIADAKMVVDSVTVYP